MRRIFSTAKSSVCAIIRSSLTLDICQCLHWRNIPSSLANALNEAGLDPVQIVCLAGRPGILFQAAISFGCTVDSWMVFGLGASKLAW